MRCNSSRNRNCDVLLRHMSEDRDRLGRERDRERERKEEREKEDKGRSI